MPKAIKKKIPKKVTDTEEEVKERLSSFRDTLKERQQTVLKYGIGILIILIAVVGFFVYSQTLQKKAKGLEYEAYKTYHSNPQMQGAIKEEQNKKALDLFRQAYNTKKSPTSLFYIAAIQYELGQYDDSLKTLKDFAQKYSGDEQFIPLAYHKMATIYIQKGDIKEAKKSLDLLYNLRTDIFKDFALIEYGRLLEKEGKMDEAKKKYEELATKFPNSPFIDEVKPKLPEKKEG
jgi:predicted negative regulator of RcsB-dependent stress response